MIALDRREVPPVDPILYFGTSAGGLSDTILSVPAVATMAFFPGEVGVHGKVRKK